MVSRCFVTLHSISRHDLLDISWISRTPRCTSLMVHYRWAAAHTQLLVAEKKPLQLYKAREGGEKRELQEVVLGNQSRRNSRTCTGQVHNYNLGTPYLRNPVDSAHHQLLLM